MPTLVIEIVALSATAKPDEVANIPVKIGTLFFSQVLFDSDDASRERAIACSTTAASRSHRRMLVSSRSAHVSKCRVER
jgi:hypothetical protein